jgi:hypothetical protein
MREFKLFQDVREIRRLSARAKVGKADNVLEDHVPDICFASRQVEPIPLEELTLSKAGLFSGDSGALGERHGVSSI